MRPFSARAVTGRIRGPARRTAAEFVLPDLASLAPAAQAEEVTTSLTNQAGVQGMFRAIFDGPAD
jgi:hypothetical protein